MKEKGSTVLQKAQEKTMSVIKVGMDDSCPGCPEYTLESDAAVFHRDSHMKRLSSPAQEHSTSCRDWGADQQCHWDVFLRPNKLSPPNTFCPLENFPSSL